MTTTVIWRWGWDGDDCVREHPYDWASDGGVDVAASIVQDHIEENGTDGAETFAIEILSPAKWAGIYDVGIDWSPHAYATKQQPADAACARQHEEREAAGEVATNGASAPVF